MIYLLGIINWILEHTCYIVIAISVAALIVSMVMWYQTQLNIWTLGVSVKYYRCRRG